MTDDELKLLGLRALSQDIYKQYEAIQLAAAKITGEVDDEGQPHTYGHTSDWLNGEGTCGSPAELLARITASNRDHE